MDWSAFTAITPEQFTTALWETLVMVFVSLAIGTVVGTALGVLVVIARPGGLLPRPWIYRVLNPIMNIVRSLPFIILMVAIMPLTRLIVGSSIGTAAAIVPLVIFISPFIGRLVETSLLDVPHGVIEAADAMGASTAQIIWKFMLREARPALVLSLTTATIGLLGATAMAGTIGGGGIGDIALDYGYNRFDTFAMALTVVTLVIIVQLLQWAGNLLAQKLRRG